MADIEKHLAKRARLLAPTTGQLDAARRSHGNLRRALQASSFGDRVTRSYLSGSYQRSTAIRPLDDVDLIFEIDASTFPRSGLAEFFDQPPRPLEVLEAFKKAVRKCHNGTRVRLQTHSVGLVMSKLRIDVVPAIPAEQGGYVYIPDKRASEWLLSGPAIHSAMGVSINKKNRSRFKPLVRLLKGWNGTLPSTAQLKSFAVETIALRLFGQHRLRSLRSGLVSFFDFITFVGGQSSHNQWDSAGIKLHGWWPSLPDVAGTDANLLEHVDRERLRKFVPKAGIIREELIRTESIRSEDAAWRLVAKRFRGGLKRL